jgi:outer membrane protein OmpA-like peptidoglycan-associated protein
VRSSASILILIALLLIPGGVLADEKATDCPPAGHLPGYASGDKTIRDYEEHEFKRKKGDDLESVKVAGHMCQQTYMVSGDQPMSDLEIQTNYRQQLKQSGAEIIGSDDSDTWAVVSKGDQETWVQIYSQSNEIDVTVIEKSALKQSLLAPSGSDYPLIGHLPGYAAGTPEKRNFDKADFTVSDGEDSSHSVTVEGATYSVVYTPQDGVVPKSDLEIQGNYRNAILAAGGEILSQGDGETTARLLNKDQVVWISIHSQTSEIDIKALEEKPFVSSIQNPTADAMKAALEKDGHVALHLNFDFNKASLKPDAAAVIAQVVTMLKGDPALKLSIEGHTDNIGTHDYNVKLSENRAASVASAIVQSGIAADRLTSAGSGPDKPVGDNATEEGRAQNRRVELVKAG